jgi:hypothetical protein
VAAALPIIGFLGFWAAAGFVQFHNLRLQKSPTGIFDQTGGNSLDISKAFFEMGIWKFESSQVSQAVTQLEIAGHGIR